MHARRFACFLLGLWLGGSVLVWWAGLRLPAAAAHAVSTDNLNARVRMIELGPTAPAMFRYEAAEMVRSYERGWLSLQLLLGGGFLLFMLFGSRESYFLLCGIILMVGITAVERFLVMPDLTAVGRLTDFAAQGAPQPAQLAVIRTTYWGLEAARFALGVVLTGSMVFSQRRSGRTRDPRRLDVFERTDYRRVNR